MYIRVFLLFSVRAQAVKISRRWSRFKKLYVFTKTGKNTYILIFFTNETKKIDDFLILFVACVLYTNKER